MNIYAVAFITTFLAFIVGCVVGEIVGEEVEKARRMDEEDEKRRARK